MLLFACLAGGKAALLTPDIAGAMMTATFLVLLAAGLFSAAPRRPPPPCLRLQPDGLAAGVWLPLAVAVALGGNREDGGAARLAC